jgi:CRISPR-associated protein Csh2
VINENAAKHTGLSKADVNELMEGLWMGTRNLLTRSKKGHMPRLLLKIEYSKPNFFIGELAERVATLPNEVKPGEYQDVTDFKLDTAKLVELLQKYDDVIERITVIKDERLACTEEIPTKNPEQYEGIIV